jgi:hypothetical protein
MWQCVVVMQQPVIFSPKFGTKSSHTFTQSSLNVTIVCRMDCLACEDEFFVSSHHDVRGNDEYAIHLTVSHFRSRWVCNFPPKHPCIAIAFFLQHLCRHCQGVHCTFSEIFLKFEAVESIAKLGQTRYTTLNKRHHIQIVTQLVEIFYADFQDDASTVICHCITLL